MMMHGKNGLVGGNARIYGLALDVKNVLALTSITS